MKKHLTEIEKNNILRCRDENMTWIQTKRITGRSSSTIYVFGIKKAFGKKPRPGRPRLITKRVLKMILKNQFKKRQHAAKLLKS